MESQFFLLSFVLMGVAGLVAGSIMVFSRFEVARTVAAWVLSAVLLLAGGYSVYQTALPVLAKVLIMLVYVVAGLALIKSAKTRFKV